MFPLHFRKVGGFGSTKGSATRTTRVILTIVVVGHLLSACSLKRRVLYTSPWHRHTIAMGLDAKDEELESALGTKIVDARSRN